METQEFFKKWKEKYPKIFDEFFQFLDNYFFEKIGKALFSFRENDNGSVDIMLDEYELPFEMLTGIIEKFFEDNHIIITIKFQDNQFYNYIDFINDNIEIEKLYHSGKWYMNKKDCQIMAYLKAASIAEGVN